MAIKLDGEYSVSGTQIAVLNGLVDPDVLKFCIPNCRQARRDGDQMRVSLDLEIFRKSYHFESMASLTRLTDDAGYDVTGQVFAGARKVGSFDGRLIVEEGGDQQFISGKVNLHPAMNFGAVIEKMATPLARKLADNFFSRFDLAISERDF